MKAHNGGDLPVQTPEHTPPKCNDERDRQMQKRLKIVERICAEADGLLSAQEVATTLREAKTLLKSGKTGQKGPFFPRAHTTGGP